jgi:hypothetical protein
MIACWKLSQSKLVRTVQTSKKAAEMWGGECPTKHIITQVSTSDNTCIYSALKSLELFFRSIYIFERHLKSQHYGQFYLNDIYVKDIFQKYLYGRNLS